MKRMSAALGLSLLASALVFSLAKAAGEARSANYCFPSYQADRCLSIGDSLGAAVSGFFVDIQAGLLKLTAGAFWLLDRGAAFIFNKAVIENTWIMNIRNQMLQQFAGLMPGLLRDMVLGSSGLMYVALALAGVVMAAPMLAAGERLVKADRVVAWGVILIALFISGRFGYDLIAAIENFRQGQVNRIIAGAHLPTDKLILQPMRAGGGDLGFNDSDLLKLPPAFESDFFPEAEEMEISIQMTDSGATFGNMWVETEQSLKRRAEQSMSGIFYAVISLFGAYLMFIFSFAYVLLTFAALVLIVFFFAALPLGFFEFGNVFLVNLLGRYMQLTALSLALAVFSRWFSSGLGFVTNVNTVETAFLWLVALVVFIAITHVFLDGALKLLTQSAQSFGSDLKTLYGGPSAVGAAKSGVGSVIAGGVSAAALLAGRGDVAAAVNAFNKSPAAQPAAAAESAPIARGDVFAESGQTQPPAARQPAQPQAATSQPAQPQTQTGTSQPQTGTSQATQTQPGSSTLQTEAQLRAVAAREGWQDSQIRQVRQAAERSPSEDAAVENLQRAPEFERANADALRRAVRAAMPKKG